MRGTVLYAPRDVRVEDRPDPKIEKPTDAVIRLAATCICGSDLWRYRGIEDVDGPAPIGHEYAGIVEQVGSDVRTIKPGQFVVGSFFTSDNTCEICRAGVPDVLHPPGARCAHRRAGPVRADRAGRRHARRRPGMPADDLVPSLLATSDVLGTGWFGAAAAEAGPGKTVAAVGDGAVGLLGVLAARQLGADRIIAMSRHESRQAVAREFGATDVITERGDEGVARVKDLTGSVRADSCRSACASCRTASSCRTRRAGSDRASPRPAGDGRSLREIVSTLTAEGHRTKRGGQWYPPAIASLLDTERV